MELRKKVLYLVLVFMVLLVLMELSLRLFGLEPHRSNQYKIVSKPSGYIIPHKQFGFGIQPGTYSVTINEHLHYTASHNLDSHRITQPFPENYDKPEIWLLGCSFTYGLGVDDTSTFPFLLQQEWPVYRVRNMGIPGASTVHAYLQLKDEIRRNKKPEIVILNYAADLHDARNRMGRFQRQKWHESFQTEEANSVELLKEARFPWVSYYADSFEIRFLDAENMYHHFPLRKNSALINLVESRINILGEKSGFKRQCTFWIFQQIRHFCQKQGIRLVVTGLTDNNETRQMLAQLDRIGIETVDIALDIGDPSLNLRPWDGHPNARAHVLYAQKIKRYLNDIQN